MKSNIHPATHNTKVSCSCGNTFEIGSTVEELKVDICSACHPFFTGEMRFVDVQGRVEKFQAKMQQAQTYKAQIKQKKTQGTQKQAPKSLREMMSDLKAQSSPESSPKK
jgi:large subunit ribosomal protein L31